MHRYLSGLLDPFVTLLEVHKLMYFMQEAGEPLKLQYTKASYGPYAENLRHVLHAVEGHLISGYADGGYVPNKQLELVPGAIAEANTFLKMIREPKSGSNALQSSSQGSKTPFGLELTRDRSLGGNPRSCADNRRGVEALLRLGRSQEAFHASTGKLSVRNSPHEGMGAGKRRGAGPGGTAHKESPPQ